MKRHNFGGQQPNLTGTGNGPIDLRHLEAAKQSAEMGVRNLVMDTNRQLFIALVARHVPLPVVGTKLDAELVRRCAAVAIAASPFYAEAIGLVEINVEEHLGQGAK